MKSKRIFTFLLGSLIAMACMANVHLTPEQLSGRSTKGLYGKVKTAVYSTGETITFNREGNITEIKTENYVSTRSYINSTRYVVDNEPYFTYNILFTANTRKEIMDNREGLYDEYTYDSQGRLSHVRHFDYAGRTEEYFYKGSDKYPHKSVIEFYDEGGTLTVTNIYLYIDVDAHGNWTKRRVNSTRKNIETDPDEAEKVTTETSSYVETRTLTYFKDAAPAPIKAPSLEVTAPEAIGVNDQFRLTFTFDSNPQSVQLMPSDNFEVLMGPATTTSTTTATATNKITTKIAYTYILTAKRKGKILLPKFAAQIDGQNVSAKATYINVVDEAPPVIKKPVEKDSVFVKVILDKESIRKGESVLCTLKIYTLNEISAVDGVSHIDFPYCYIEEQETPNNQSYVQEQIQKANYKTLIYRQFKLTPLQVGEIRIPPIKFDFTFMRSTGKDPFDTFFNDNKIKIQKSASTDPITISVIQ